MPVKASFPEILAQSTGLEIKTEQVDAIKSYVKMLLAYNEQVNLTAIAEEGEIWRKHVLDSLLIFCTLTIPAGARVIDVGTGAGIPGFILKIYRQDLKLTLLEAQLKKVKFLEKVIKELGLVGIECLWGRAEEIGREARFRENFDLAVARGVAPLNILAEYCLPLVQVGGAMVAYKGPAGEEELKAASRALYLLGGGEARVWWQRLPGGGEKRLLVIVRKERATPASYPRRPGIPAKRPLK